MAYPRKELRVVAMVFAVSVIMALAACAGVSAGDPTQQRMIGGWQPGPDAYHPSRIIVRFADTITASAVADSIQRLGYSLYRVADFQATATFPSGLKIGIVELPESETPDAAVAALSAAPGILYAEKDYIRYRFNAHQDTPVFPDDVYFNKTWGLHNHGCQYKDPEMFGDPVDDADIDAPEAWAFTTGSDEVIVAVIDTGIYVDHPDLNANMWRNPDEIPGNGIDDDNNGYIDDVYGWDFYNNDSSVFDPGQRDPESGRLSDEHGTHCAGTIGAIGNNAMGVPGVNWNVKIMSLKFIGPDGGSSSDAILALQYAQAKGAKVINCSWGGGGFNHALKEAIEATNAIVCCAAGNNGQNNDIDPHYPSSYDSANIISVAAMMQNEQPCMYPGWWRTCYGATSVDLFAPGGYILSTLPPDPVPPEPAEHYGFSYGTSMATPHVTGAAALIHSFRPNIPLYPGAPGWTPGQYTVKDAILDTVDVKPVYQGRVLTGGRLNLAAALLEVSGPKITSIDAEPRRGSPPLEVAFTAAAQSSCGEIVDKWWDFGDGSELVHEFGAVHTYTELGDYIATFHAVDGEGSEATASVTISVVLPPAIGVDPDEIHVDLWWGEEATRQITIGNTGSGELQYNVNIKLVGQLDPSGETTLGHGGPDPFGYLWIDTDEPGVDPPEWQDIRPIGTQIHLGHNRGIVVDLPFEFPFYGQKKTQVGISSNGYLTFSDVFNKWLNTTLPNPGPPNDLLAAFWSYLNPAEGGACHFYGDDEVFVVQYTEVPSGSGRDSYTFQVRLTPQGIITYHYSSMVGTRLDQATIGIENAAGTVGLEVAYNRPYVHDGLGVIFLPGWVTSSKTRGTVQPGKTDSLDVTFIADHLPKGTWKAMIEIESNDPANPKVDVDTLMLVRSRIFPTIRSATADPWAGSAPLEVHFAVDAHDEDGQIESVMWDFGDGSSTVSGELNPVHTYAANGNYTATVTVTDDDGFEAAAEITIVVADLPKAAVEPVAFNQVIRAHRQRSEVLTVTNIGDGPMLFTATAHTAGAYTGGSADAGSDPAPTPPAWMSVEPAQGELAAGEEMNLNVKFDLATVASGILNGAVVLDTNDVLEPQVAVPVRVEVIPNSPPQITACSVNPVSGSPGSSFQFVAAAHDPDGSIVEKEWNFGDGTPVVQEFVINHVYAEPGVYTATFRAVDDDGYVATKSVEVNVGDPASASWSPTQLRLYVSSQEVSDTITLSNAGPGELVFGAGVYPYTVALPERAFAAEDISDPDAKTACGMYMPNADCARSAWLPEEVGSVAMSWPCPPPIDNGWGVGVLQNTQHVVVGDSILVADFVITPEGLPTEMSWSADFGGAWAADMAFDGRYIWQVSVGGDNGIYKVDPETGAVVGSIFHPEWAMGSQRGLAYDPNDDTFYIGGWNEGIIYKIKGESWDEPGEVVEQWSMPVPIAGLAYHPVANILVVTTDAVPDMVYFVDPVSHALLAQFPHPYNGFHSGAGCEFAADGRLWVMSKEDNSMYLVNTGLGPADASWLSWTPDAGRVPAGESAAITVTVDPERLYPGTYSANVVLTANDPANPLIVVPVTAEVARGPAIIEASAEPALGEPPLAVSFSAAFIAPEVPIADFGWDFGDGTSSSEADVVHVYTMPGDYTAVFSVVDELGATAEATLNVMVKWLPHATVDPARIEATVPANGVYTHTITVGNAEGNAPLSFDVRARAGQAPVAAPLSRTGTAIDPNAPTTEGLYLPLDPATVEKISNRVAPDGVGSVIASWRIPMEIRQGWGLGFDTANLWISDPQSSKNYVVTPEGRLTGTVFDTPWAGAWAADMAYDPNRGLMWQVNVGGDNGIYGLNPATGEVVMKITSGGDWTLIGQRGLGYDAGTDTFYIGGWTMNTIFHIMGPSWSTPGAVLSAHPFPVGIAGLEYHPDGILWVSTNSFPDMIYAIDVESFTVVHQFFHPYKGNYSGAGLALNSDGNLWVSSMENRTVYLIDTEMPVAPAIVIDPVSGMIPQGETADVEVTIDIAQIGQPGQDIRKHLAITTNDPFDREILVDLAIHIEAAPTIVRATATPTIGEPPLTVAFAAVVQQGASPIADVWWDFGDGSDPVHEADTVHVYSELGEYEAEFHAVDENGVETVEKVAVTVKWLPQLVVDPEEFSIVIPADTETQTTMTISNPGAAPMDFQVEALPVFAHGSELESSETSEPSRFMGNQAHDSDQFGYVWVDSNEQGGPEFHWIEISELGTRVQLRNDDGVMVPLPFAFPFYGEAKTRVGICDNGYLTFDPDSLRGAFRNRPIPDSDRPNDILAAFWFDLVPDRGGEIYYYHDSARGRFIVEYKNMPTWNRETSYTFQIILYPDGAILFQYLEMIGELTRATVGIENGAGTDGLQVAFNAPYIEDQLAVGFAPVKRILRVNPASGYLMPGRSQEIMLTVGSPDAGYGTYSFCLWVMSDDPYRPLATIPVTLKFNAAPAVQITAPVGDETWAGMQEIRWTASDPDDAADALTVDLYWSRNGGEWNEIAKGLANTGSYMWNTAGVGLGGDAFRVRIVVTDPAGQAAEIISEPFTIVNDAPTAAFTFSPSPATVTSLVEFVDESTDDGEIIAWHWEFGDGAESAERNPKHQYSAKGQFTVRLTVTDNGGLTGVCEKQIQVVNVAPTVRIISPSAGETWTRAREIEYEASDPDGDPLAIRLEYDRLGDTAGWQLIAENRENTGKYLWDISKLAKGGEYKVRVAASDPDGGTAEAISGEFTIIVLKHMATAAPNPAKDSVTFYYDIESDAMIYVYDVAGRLVYSADLAAGTNAHEWNLTAGDRPLAAGLYLYAVVTADGARSEVGRLVIER